MVLRPNWPPTAAELKHSKYDPPTSLTLFLEALLKTSNHSTTRSINTSRLVISFAQDIVYAITKGKIFQLKQYLLAMGLHNLTGSRKVIDLVQKFGHCMNYNFVSDILTSNAEVALLLSKEQNTLPLQPESPEYTVFTHFWVDNFDVLVDRPIGGGSIHTTHLVSFQEMSIGCVKSNHQISLQRRKSRKLFLEDININTISIDKKINPPDVFPVCPEEVDETQFNTLYLIWVFLRKNNSYQQSIPIFKGWKLQIRSATNLPTIIQKTVETYLPPINAKVTEYSTIQQYMKYLQKLSGEANMPYVNITLDVGAAMNAFLVTWYAPEVFDNIIIHLGSFHFLKENFQVSSRHELKLFLTLFPAN